MEIDNEANKPLRGEWDKFRVILSAEEVDLFEKNIEDGCEQVNEQAVFFNPFDE